MFDFEALSQAIPRQTVLCVGDLMLDEFVYGEVSRISPEAPAPVIAVQRSETNVGGAGNVARNIASLGARCIFAGLVGGDEAGAKLKADLARETLIEAVLVSDSSRPTTRKVRFVSEHFSTHMLRADWEQAVPASAEIEQKLIDAILPQVARADIVLLSDYAKGVLTARVIRNIIDAAKKLGKRVIVDPKSPNFALYRGATLLTPNRKEFAEATRSRADTGLNIAAAAQDAMVLADCEAMLVTQSEHGMTLVVRGGEAIHVPALPVKVRDVSGAGDTVAAVLALTLAANADWEMALRMANAAAAVAVGKKGTATVTPAELRRKILPHASLAAEEKIVAAGGDLAAHLAEWRRQGLRIGFTNGCFDILHPGHVKVLTAARGACDRLIVGLNSDASVKRLKGEGRPVQDERARAEVLAALEAVDLVAIFEEDTPIDLITRVRPSVLVKGGDYTREQVVGHKIVEATGGEVVLVDILPGPQHDVAGRPRAGRQGVSLSTTAAPPTSLVRRYWRDRTLWTTIADVFAILAAFSLPWSTTLPAIFVPLWLGAVAWVMDWRAYGRLLKQPICYLPFALVGLALIGTLWSDAAWGARLYAIAPTLKLLVLPGLFYHFERSSRGMWVFVAFMVSCALLMVVSWLVVIDPSLSLKAPDEAGGRGIFVKNYIDQSQEFALCAVALAYPIIRLLQANRMWQALMLGAISLGFIVNMAFVIVSRTAMVTIPIMLAVFALLHLKWRTSLLIFGVLAVMAGLAWATSPQLQQTLDTFSRDYRLYKTDNAPTSIGIRLEFWKKSLRFFAEAPVVGHGTGSTRGLFERAATGDTYSATSQVIGNPHNQTLNVAVQWGTAGIILLYAIWLVHLLLFRGDDLAAWIGLLVVVQNIFTSLFNSHIFDFHEGWMYVLGVGIAGGMTLAAKQRNARAEPAGS